MHINRSDALKHFPFSKKSLPVVTFFGFYQSNNRDLRLLELEFSQILQLSHRQLRIAAGKKKKNPVPILAELFLVHFIFVIQTSVSSCSVTVAYVKQ